MAKRHITPATAYTPEQVEALHAKNRDTWAREGFMYRSHQLNMKRVAACHPSKLQHLDESHPLSPNYIGGLESFEKMQAAQKPIDAQYRADLNALRFEFRMERVWMSDTYTQSDLINEIKALGFNARAVSKVRIIADNGKTGAEWRGMQCDVLGDLIQGRREVGVERGCAKTRAANLFE
jgi:hypothetical protein